MYMYLPLTQAKNTLFSALDFKSQLSCSPELSRQLVLLILALRLLYRVAALFIVQDCRTVDCCIVCCVVSRAKSADV